MQGIVFDIQKFSLHDGPGIRTTVFLKGCPLKCRWCQNPEGLKPSPEVQFTKAWCTGCGMCEKAGIEACPTGARKIVGRKMTVSQVVDSIMEDEVYYKMSGGGMTLSGGDPLFQPEFSARLLAECRKRGIHTAVETSLFASWEKVEQILEHTDLMLIDIKVMDPDKHRKLTGRSNTKILRNISLVSQRNVPFAIRMPVVPGLNDSDRDIQNIKAFAGPLKNLQYVEVLPFHKLGEHKYAGAGLQNLTGHIPQLSEKRLNEIKGALNGLPQQTRSNIQKKERAYLS